MVNMSNPVFSNNVYPSVILASGIAKQGSKDSTETIDGIKFKKGSVVRDEVYKTYVGVLAGTQKVGKFTLPSGTRAGFSGRGDLASFDLIADMEIMGTKFKAGSKVTMYPEFGIVKKIEMQTPHKVQGRMCGAGVIEFSTDGKISSCVLAADEKFNGMTVPAGSTVEFSFEGVPYAFTFSKPMEIGGLKYSYIETTPAGKLALGKLSEDQTVQGIRFKAGTVVGFYKSGKLGRAILAGEHEIKGKKYADGYALDFDEKTGEVAYDRPAWFLPLEMSRP